MSFRLPQVEIKKFRIELWPGFITSIRQHELNILSCIEVAHKV
jgi:aubergine-like protein